MEIKALKLWYRNFKGIKDFEIDLYQATNVFGDNATGKTSLIDGFFWLLFDKDSSDNSKFGIKTFDEKGEIIPKLEHEVGGVFLINGEEITIKKILREKWEKRRGGTDFFFNGNETLVFWNDVPMQATKYAAKISELINEDTFKLVTNPLYFNSVKYGWKQRRETLLKIAGHIDNNEILADIVTGDNDTQIAALAAAFKSRKTIEEYRAEIGAKKKKLKDELVLIPSRVDEVRRGMPQVLAYAMIEAEINVKQGELHSIDEEMVNASKAQKVANEAMQAKQKKLFEHKTEKQNIEFAVKAQFNEAKNVRANNIKAKLSELQTLTTNITNADQAIVSAREKVEKLTPLLAAKKTEWTTENAKQLIFNEGEFCCPACKTPFAPEKVEEEKKKLTVNFNTDKQNQLEEIKKAGADLAAKLSAEKNTVLKKADEAESLEQSKKDLTAEIEALKAEHDRLNADLIAEINRLLSANEDYITVNTLISALENALGKAPENTVDLSTFQTRKNAINTEIDSLKKQLATKETREQSLKRVVELEKQQTEFSQQLADLEGYENAIADFTRAKMETLVDRINGRFRYVSFKLFEKQVNGGEVECCETLVPSPGGLVPFSDANNAARINAGLDIINTLCQHYNVSAPIWVDNAESVNSLIAVESQLIRLVVSHDKALRIEPQ